MLQKITHNLTILAAKKLLDNFDAGEVSTSKRLISIAAGAYIFQRGVRSLYKHPILGIQEVLLGGYLLYESVKDIKDNYHVLPTEPSDIRRNQIQGNDPNAAVPAFV